MFHYNNHSTVKKLCTILTRAWDLLSLHFTGLFRDLISAHYHESVLIFLLSPVNSTDFIVTIVCNELS